MVEIMYFNSIQLCEIVLSPIYRATANTKTNPNPNSNPGHRPRPLTVAKPAWAPTQAANTVAKPAWAPTQAANTVAKPAWAPTQATNRGKTGLGTNAHL